MDVLLLSYMFEMLSLSWGQVQQCAGWFTDVRKASCLTGGEEVWSAVYLTFPFQSIHMLSSPGPE